MSGVSGSFRLHSQYNPEREAERYLDAQTLSCDPAFIVVTEPGESFLAPVLRKKFLTAKLVCIRYHRDFFLSSDQLWDVVWRPDSEQDVASFLFNLIPDEYLSLTAFFPWKPSDSQWPDISSQVWNSIASMIRLQTSVMYTRTHFGMRWLKNCIRNIALARTVVYPVHTAKPVFIAAAGPSLEKQFPVESDKFFVCAVSSALACISAHGCDPDLCISTDGGYWAMNHFRGIAPHIPVAFPPEAAIPSAVLESNPLLFLDYGSELEKKLFEIAGCIPEKASRNGTVSGTAALYMLAHTDASVYIAGLDLQSSTSFSHARPNANGSSTDSTNNRFRPLAETLYEANRDNASLEMYASWFENRDENFRNRFFRLAPAGRPIRGVQTVLLSATQGLKSTEKEPLAFQDIPDRAERIERLLVWLKTLRSEFEKGSEAFIQKPVNREILQMVSYTDYLKYMKKVLSASEISQKAACSIGKFILIVSGYGASI